MSRFDFDYDVFYPWVKDAEVCSGMSFREILQKYDQGNELNNIEDALPLLTIYIPDWSLIIKDAFSVIKWNTDSPYIGVSPRCDSKTHPVFFNGDLAFELEPGEFSDAAILIVKENERMTFQTGTKGLEKSYHFISLNFDNTLGTKASYNYSTVYLPYETASDMVDTSSLPSCVTGSYDVWAYDNRVAQRDYIYYGMTSQIDSGCVNRNYKECLRKIKINPSNLGLYDNSASSSAYGNDYSFKKYTYQAGISGYAPKLTAQELAEKVFADGSLEIKISVFAGSRKIVNYYLVPFVDAFYVKKVDELIKYNALGAQKTRTYYLSISSDYSNIQDYLEPKWIDINMDLFCWDIVDIPKFYSVEFSECDSGETITTTRSFSFEQMRNYHYSLSLGNALVKAGWQQGGEDTVTNSYNHSISYTSGSDDLGCVVVDYNDKVLLSKNSSEAQIKTYSTGFVTAVFIPKYE